MNPTNTPRPNSPTIQDLMLRYLERQATAEEGELVITGDVEPYQASVGISTEPRVAWSDAQSAINTMHPRSLHKIAMPPEWGNWVMQSGAETAIAFAAGNFPEDVQDIATLVETRPLSRLQPNSTESSHISSTMQKWLDQRMRSGNVAEQLLAVGIFRRLGAFEQAERLLKQVSATAGTEWRTAVLNEQAALAWQQGEADEALELWESAGDSVVVLFNRGMALLFLDRANEARVMLRKVTEQLPETTSWHHLAGLYTALAEMRG